MWCMICGKTVSNCTCKDIDERLNKLKENEVISISVMSNISDRNRKRSLEK